MSETASRPYREVPRWMRKGVTIAFLIFACAAAYSVGVFFHQIAPPNEGLTIPDSYLDFGDVWEDPGFRWKLLLENPTEKNIQISRFESSCTCLSIQPKSIVISPGERAFVEMTLDLAFKHAEEADLPIRDFTVRIIPYVRGGLPNLQGWVVRGRVRSPIKMSPRSIYFWQELADGGPIAPKRVTITSHLPVQGLEILSESQFISTKLSKKANDPQAFELDVFPPSSLPSGPFTFAIFVYAIRPDGTRLPPSSLQVSGFFQGWIEALPSHIAFGPRRKGEKVEETILLRSSMGKGIHLEGINTSAKELTVEPLPKGSKGEVAFRLVQLISREGAQRNLLEFILGGTTGESQRIPITITYFGVSK
jgi:hypothetical protein